MPDESVTIVIPGSTRVVDVVGIGVVGGIGDTGIMGVVDTGVVGDTGGSTGLGLSAIDCVLTISFSKFMRQIYESKK
jgi:hypothetical protein